MIKSAHKQTNPFKGLILSLKDEIKALVIRKGRSMKWLASEIDRRRGKNTSYQNFYQKLARESLKYEEAKEIASILGYEIIWVDKKH